jgi:hypothetical protein
MPHPLAIDNARQVEARAEAFVQEGLLSEAIRVVYEALESVGYPSWQMAESAVLKRWPTETAALVSAGSSPNHRGSMSQEK